ncbi:MAG: YraN family protein [Thermomicrobiales bacterium]
MPGTSRDRRHTLGAAGESHALRYLEAQGHRLVARNWHCRSGELDLVTLDGEILVFVEVKTRRGERAGRADDAVTGAKAARMLSAATWFLAEHPEHQERVWRCDLIAIAVDAVSGSAKIRHYPNAIVSD